MLILTLIFFALARYLSNKYELTTSLDKQYAILAKHNILSCTQETIPQTTLKIFNVQVKESAATVPIPVIALQSSDDQIEKYLFPHGCFGSQWKPSFPTKCKVAALDGQIEELQIHSYYKYLGDTSSLDIQQTRKALASFSWPDGHRQHRIKNE